MTSLVWFSVITLNVDVPNSFYIILRGSVSVFIDPKMTGEGVDESTARASAAAKRKSVKKLPKAPESEVSILSGMEKASGGLQLILIIDVIAYWEMFIFIVSTAVLQNHFFPSGLAHSIWPASGKKRSYALCGQRTSIPAR